MGYDALRLVQCVVKRLLRRSREKYLVRGIHAHTARATRTAIPKARSRNPFPSTRPGGGGGSMSEHVEPRVRGLVAEYLGVEPQELTPDVSLVDDLAADSLNLVELALVLESQFGIVITEAALDRLRTYGELVETVAGLTRTREAEARAEAQATPALVWARVVRPGVSQADLHRAGWLTPYTTETIVEDALHAGRGARLEMVVSSTVSDGKLAQLKDDFGWLWSRGVQVSIRRDHHLGPAGQGVSPHAAA